MDIINKTLRLFFFVVIVRPIVKLVIGLNFRNRPELPSAGPAIIIANHNSHLDTMVLMSLLPIHLLAKVQPVAAADYFLSNPIKKWFATKIIGILPIQRTPNTDDKKPSCNPLEPCKTALAAGKILIFFPEGSRGDPESLSEFKFGIAKLASQCPTTPIYPIYMHGLGKALPKGQFILVPFFCDIAFNPPLYFSSTPQQFYSELKTTFNQLKETVKVPSWD
ncbi:MAG: 1-acyl-sn-glycerol-3-phosphate acyltransferase [Gammaproteobacteria bacterium]|nr:1-acyl-sn-glycerol-3-phosphate acyltransferase [Gammaproteobacteria bacterium]NVK88601.1 1-acyl-sn-glycerol-3-phosphate acyltransferase [Gammaproteobacteria bacterium]